MDILENIDMNNKTNIVLRDFQLTAVQKLCDNEKDHNIGSVLAFDMGLGKTLTFASFLLRQREVENPSAPDLIIVPLCVLGQWKKEILRIDSTSDIFIYHGPKRVNDLKNCLKFPDIIICTYHCLVTRELECYEWNRIVLDEAHTIRNGIANEFRNLPKRVIGAYALKEKSKFRHCITGTPYNNNTNNVLSLMKFIGYDGESVDIFIRDFVLQKTKENIMDSIISETILIGKPTDGLDDYKYLVQRYTILMNILKNKTNRIEAREMYSQAMKIMAKLRVFCDIMQMNTAKRIAIEDEDEENDDDEEYKTYFFEEVDYSFEEKSNFYNSSIKVKTIYDKLDDMIRVVPYKRIIIFSSFVTTLNILESVINSKDDEILTFQYTGKQNREQREEIVIKFTDMEQTRPMVLLASLGAGSCGLNLVPCSTVFLADISMNPFDQLQAINRVHRITQTNQVNVYKFCMKSMIEENILMSHFRKIEEAKSNGLLII